MIHHEHSIDKIEGMNVKKLLIMVVFMVICGSVNVYAEGFVIDTSRAETGVFEVKGIPGANKIRIIVEKEGTRERYIYFLSDVNSNVFPLQMGGGRYTITLLENIIRNESKKILAKTVDVEEIDPELLFTQSIQIIDYDRSDIAVSSFRERVRAAKRKKDKLKIVYEFIIDNIDYDFDKVPETLFDYLPVIDETYVTRKGICYDYAALVAGALRSRGIPTKLQKGYTANIPAVFHAWNAVYIEGEWFKIDTTYDRQLRKAGLNVNMIKDCEKFIVVREF